MQAQADFLDIYRPLANAATETLKVALERNDRLTNRLAEARSIDDLFVAQSEFAFSQVTQGIELWWRLFRAMQDSQLAMMQHASSWSGAERRKASVLPFRGPERRKVA